MAELMLWSWMEAGPMRDWTKGTAPKLPHFLNCRLARCAQYMYVQCGVFFCCCLFFCLEPIELAGYYCSSLWHQCTRLFLLVIDFVTLKCTIVSGFLTGYFSFVWCFVVLFCFFLSMIRISILHHVVCWVESVCVWTFDYMCNFFFNSKGAEVHLHRCPGAVVVGSLFTWEWSVFHKCVWWVWVLNVYFGHPLANVPQSCMVSMFVLYVLYVCCWWYVDVQIILWSCAICWTWSCL